MFLNQGEFWMPDNCNKREADRGLILMSHHHLPCWHPAEAFKHDTTLNDASIKD